MFAGFPICADAIAFVLECEDQRVAARVLGFDFYSWFASKAPQPASTEKTWIEMTDEEKSALLALGYSAHGWDTREPHSSYKLWGDLTDEEKAAAEVLGYNAVRWNDKEDKAKQPQHLKKYWEELTFDEQTAVEVLGFTDTMWDAGSSGRPRSKIGTN